MVNHTCDPGCKDHAEASRVQALSEVEQLLYFRWRAAWDEWSASLEGGYPTRRSKPLWERMTQALEDLEAVQEINR